MSRYGSHQLSIQRSSTKSRDFTLISPPLAICKGGGNGSYGDKLTFAGLMAFEVSLEKGTSEHGRMPFVDPAQATGQCNQSWTDSQLRVVALANMSTPLQMVSLKGEPRP
jgi:hypothetical protein